MMNTFRQQCLLLYLGYKPGTPDGIRGTLTADAIEDFQRDNGLIHDRIWGAKTEAKARYNFDHDVFKPEQEVADTTTPATATGEASSTATSDKSSATVTKTGTFWDNIKHFTRTEFRCPCGKWCNGFPVEPQESLVRFLDEMRDALGHEIVVVPPDGHSGGSGVRCDKYNATLSGSASNSTHKQGRAADFSVRGVSDATVASYLATAKANGKIAYWYKITSGAFHANI